MVKLYINGNELTNFILSTPYKDTLDAELDKLNFQIKSTTRLTFKKNDKIRYWNYVSKNNTNYTLIDKNLCLFDWLETLEGEYWLYQLTCFSPTKLLEGIIINGMANTGLGATTLNTNMTQVVDKINAQQKMEWSVETNNTQYSYQHPITITYNEANNQPLRQYDANDFLWSGQMTAREILNEIADKGDSIVVATDFSFSDDYLTSITITTQKKEGSGNEILSSNSDIDGGGLDAIEEVVEGLSIHRDSELNNNLIVSLIKNGIARDNMQSMYLPARNDDLTIDDSADWHILTDQPIYSLNRVIMQVPLICVASNCYFWIKNQYNGWSTKELSASSLGSGAFFVCCPIDITNFIVEKDVFDAMSLSEQSKHLYFKRGEKGIYGLFKKYKSGLAGLFSNTAIKNILDSINRPNYLASYENSNGVVDWTRFANAQFLGCDSNGITSEITASYSDSNNSYVNVHLSKDGERSLGTIASIGGGTEGGTPIVAYNDNYLIFSLFSVNYQPYTDSVVLTEKASAIERQTNTKNLAMLKNQNDRTINAEKYYASQQSLVDRSGNDEMTIDVMYNKNNLASYYENPTTYKNSFWGLGDYFTLNSKKWSLIAREIEEYSEEYIKTRLTFSKQFNARNSAINENKDKRLYGIPLNNYVDRFIIIRAFGLGDNPNKKFLIRCWDDFTNNTTTEGFCLKDAVSLGNTSKKDLVVAMKDNYAVDIEKTTYSSTRVNINLRYTDNDGKLENLDLILETPTGIQERLNSSSAVGYGRLPFMITPFWDGNYGVKHSYNVKKDKMERLILVFKNH